MSKNYLPLKEELTDRALGPLLAIIRELQPYLLEPTREPGSTPTADKLDGGVESAAATTFLKTCARLDFILDDEKRWSLKIHNTLVSEMVRTHKAQQRFIAIQSASSEKLQSPQFLLKPTLAVMDGSYVAYWGDLSKPGQAIAGMGETPQAALDDFDEAFQRAPKDQIFLVSEKAGIDINHLKTPPTQ